MMSNSRSFYRMLAEATGLEFVNAIAPAPRSRKDPLATGQDLMAWLIRADLASSETLEGVQATALPGELDAVAAQAVALGKWFRGFICRYRGKPLPPTAIDELQRLNRILERDSLFGQVSASKVRRRRRPPSELAWRPQRQYRTPDALLLPVAHAMAELVCGADFTYIRECEGDGCTFLFLDRTRAHARRWCCMATCGNRAKQAARRGIPYGRQLISQPTS